MMHRFLNQTFIFILILACVGVPAQSVSASEYLSPIAQIIQSAFTTQTSSSQSKITAPLVLAYTNIERYKEGLPLLTQNTQLSNVAHTKMRDLFARQYFAHESPTGESVSDLAKSAGYSYIVVGENLALGDFSSSKGVVEAWMKSEGHKKNILSQAYSEIGIAAGEGTYKGRKTWIIVQSFGTPTSNCPAIDAGVMYSLEMLEKKLTVYESIAEYRKAQVEQSVGTVYEKEVAVESYNLAARIYNLTVAEYKKLAESYNTEVGKYNACLKTTVGGLE